MTILRAAILAAFIAAFIIAPLASATECAQYDRRASEYQERAAQYQDDWFQFQNNLGGCAGGYYDECAEEKKERLHSRARELNTELAQLHTLYWKCRP